MFKAPSDTHANALKRFTFSHRSETKFSPLARRRLGMNAEPRNHRSSLGSFDPGSDLIPESGAPPQTKQTSVKGAEAGEDTRVCRRMTAGSRDGRKTSGIHPAEPNAAVSNCK